VVGRAEKRGKESRGGTGEKSSVQGHAKGRHILNSGHDKRRRRTWASNRRQFPFRGYSCIHLASG